jgi:hypothetical protein
MENRNWFAVEEPDIESKESEVTKPIAPKVSLQAASISGTEQRPTQIKLLLDPERPQM